jgi:hypothetical protein
MTGREFEASARQFVIDTLRLTSGRLPPKDVVDRTTAKLVDNFKPIVSCSPKAERGERLTG